MLHLTLDAPIRQAPKGRPFTSEDDAELMADLKALLEATDALRTHKGYEVAGRFVRSTTEGLRALVLCEQKQGLQAPKPHRASA